MGQRRVTTEGMTALERLQFELNHPPFHSFLKPEAVAADSERGTVEILLRQRYEFQRVPDKPEYHGGVIAALIDMTAHAAVAVKIGRMAPTIDLRIDYMRWPRIRTFMLTAAYGERGVRSPWLTSKSWMMPASRSRLAVGC